MNWYYYDVFGKGVAIKGMTATLTIKHKAEMLDRFHSLSSI